MAEMTYRFLVCLLPLCYAINITDNLVVVKNGDEATLHFDISACNSADFIYINDPYYNVVGVYTGDGKFYKGSEYSAPENLVTINDYNIAVIIPHVQKTVHAGSFTCGYLNQRPLLPNCGSVLVVKDTPTLPRIRLLQTPVYGNTVTMKCVSESTTLPRAYRPKLNYTWYRDDMELLHGEHFTVSGASLTVNVTHRGEHRFECIAGEENLKTNLARKVFQPEYSPYGIQTNTSDLISPKIGSSVTVACTARCKPECSYIWSCRGNPRHGSGDGILRFSPVTRRHGGRYSCKASNGHGHHNISIRIDVLYPPSCNIGDHNRRLVTENETIVLTCDVDSNPAPVVTWLKDGEIVPGTYLGNRTGTAEGFIQHLSRYQYKQVKALCDDSGTYTCRADNGIPPSAEVKSSLVIKCAIRRMNTSRDTKRFIRPKQSTLVVTISILAFPKPRAVKWSLVEKNTEHDVNRSRCITEWSKGRTDYLHTLKLIHSKLHRVDSGVYRLELNNGIGLNLIEHYEIVVQDSPEVPTGLTVLYLDFESVTVGWTKGFNRNAKQRFEITLSSPKMTATHWTDEDTTHSTFSKLQNGTVYEIRVRARNDFGTSDYSPVLRVKIGEGTIDAGAVPSDAVSFVDREAGLWSATILGVTAISLTILFACYWTLKACPLRGLRKRRPSIGQEEPRHEYEGMNVLSTAAISKDNIYDEIGIKMTDSGPPSAVYLRPTDNACTHVRHGDPRRPISVA